MTLFLYRTPRMTDKEKNEFFGDFIRWQQKGLDINQYHCLFINFGAIVKFENSQIRRLNVIFSIIFLNFKTVKSKVKVR